jgi:general stress protein YciG
MAHKFAKALGRKGGKARAANLGPEELSRIGKLGAERSVAARAACQHVNTTTGTPARSDVLHYYCTSCKRRLGPVIP